MPDDRLAGPQPVRVVHSQPVWLPQTQPWLYNLVRTCGIRRPVGYRLRAGREPGAVSPASPSCSHPSQRWTSLEPQAPAILAEPGLHALPRHVGSTGRRPSRPLALRKHRLAGSGGRPRDQGASCRVVLRLRNRPAAQGRASMAGAVCRTVLTGRYGHYPGPVHGAVGDRPGLSQAQDACSPPRYRDRANSLCDRDNGSREHHFGS